MAAPFYIEKVQRASSTFTGSFKKSKREEKMAEKAKQKDTLKGSTTVSVQ